MSLVAAYIVAAVIGGAGVVVAAVIALFGVWRQNRQATIRAAMAETQQLIDQLQEERTEIKTSLLSAHLKIDRLSLRQRYWEDYVNELRSHIEQGHPPPPPGYPQGLLRID